MSGQGWKILSGAQRRGRNCKAVGNRSSKTIQIVARCFSDNAKSTGDVTYLDKERRADKLISPENANIFVSKIQYLLYLKETGKTWNDASAIVSGVVVFEVRRSS